MQTEIWKLNAPETFARQFQRWHTTGNANRSSAAQQALAIVMRDCFAGAAYGARASSVTRCLTGDGPAVFAYRIAQRRNGRSESTSWLAQHKTGLLDRVPELLHYFLLADSKAPFGLRQNPSKVLEAVALGVAFGVGVPLTVSAASVAWVGQSAMAVIGALLGMLKGGVHVLLLGAAAREANDPCEAEAAHVRDFLQRIRDDLPFAVDDADVALVASRMRKGQALTRSLVLRAALEAWLTTECAGGRANPKLFALKDDLVAAIEAVRPLEESQDSKEIERNMFFTPFAPVDLTEDELRDPQRFNALTSAIAALSYKIHPGGLQP